jgi:hypothetical protein
MSFHHAAVLLSLLFIGCAQQAEGERCDRSNDNNDCEPGLECISLQALTGASEGAVCCPRSNPNVAICQPQTLDLNTGDDDTSAPETDPGESSAPVETTAPGETATPDETTAPIETTAPADGTMDGTTTDGMTDVVDAGLGDAAP